MDSTHAVGMLLVGISAFLLAAQWQQWRATGAEQLASSRWQLHMRRLMWRRAVASSLVGVVGATLMAFETVPQTPLSITAYLLALVLMTCWILWLACLDMLANRRFHAEQNLDRIASELRRAHADADRADSTNAD